MDSQAYRTTPHSTNHPFTTKKQLNNQSLRSSLTIRNVVVDGKRTSIRLEPEMWNSLQAICKRERCTPHDIATMIATEKGIGSLTAAIRVFVMMYFFEAATEDGHNRMHHGSGQVLQPLYQHLSKKDDKTIGL